jgi:nucleotide-binding universal stress UspA family protein
MSTSGRDAVEEAAALASKSGVKPETAEMDGRGRLVSDVIVADAKRWRADLIVMGTHGRRGFNRLLMGSDAERVLSDAPVPVLLVRREKAKRRTANTRAGRSIRR